MAQIVLGMGTSHGPMLSTPPEDWALRVAADRQAQHPFKGKVYGFNDLVELRKPENLAAQIGIEIWRKRHAACREAINTLTKVFAEAKPDVAVIVGNDQKEIFRDATTP